MRDILKVSILTAALATAAFGCSDDTDNNQTNNTSSDTGTDVSADADVGMDTTSDANDTEMDTGSDADADAGGLEPPQCNGGRFAVERDARLPIDLASTDVTFDLTFDGDSLATTETEVGVEFFFAIFNGVDSQANSIARFNSEDNSFPMYRGTYDGWVGAVLTGDSDSVVFPLFDERTFDAESDTVSTDLSTTQATVSVTIDGETPADLVSQPRGYLSFVPTSAPSSQPSYITSAPLPAAGDAVVELMLADLNYDVYLQGVQGTEVPSSRVLVASDWSPADNATLELDVETATVTSELLENGQILDDLGTPNGVRATISYVPQNTGSGAAGPALSPQGAPQVEIGSSGAAVYEAKLFSDLTYDVYVESETSVLPRQRYRLADDWSPVDGDVIEYDVTTHQLTVELTANGSPIAPNTNMRRGTVRLFDPASGTFQDYGLLAVEQGIEVYEGTYDFTVIGNPQVNDTNTLPPTAESVVATEETVDADTTLTRDISTVSISGELTNGGESFGIDDQTGRLVFLPTSIAYDTIQDMQLARLLTVTSSDGYAITLAAGQEYDVYWYGSGASDRVPAAVETIATAWTAGDQTTLDIELPAVHMVEARLLLDGEPFPIVPDDGSPVQRRAQLTFDPPGNLETFDSENDYGTVRGTVDGAGEPVGDVALFEGEYSLTLDSRYAQEVAPRGLQVIECAQ